MLTVLATVALFTYAQGTPLPVFLGYNVPWNNYGNDIGAGSFDARWFDDIFSQAAINGSNTARFWLHADGRPGGLVYDSTGAVSGLSDTFLADLGSLADLAGKHSLVLQLCLWSFDMCKDESSAGTTRASLITDLDKTNSYTQNALAPMLKSLLGRHNVLVEVINEPEWCMKETPCTTQDCVVAADMQRFVAAIAETVHEMGFKLTVGSASLKWNSPTQPPAQAHWWSDSALRAHAPAAGCASPTLDLYNVHYYDWMFDLYWGYDPMMRSTAFWNITDKLCVVAEMPASSQHYSSSQLVQLPHANGFAGSLFWAINDPNFPITAAVADLKAFKKLLGAAADFATLVKWLYPLGQPQPLACAHS